MGVYESSEGPIAYPFFVMFYCLAFQSVVDRLFQTVHFYSIRPALKAAVLRRLLSVLERGLLVWAMDVSQLLVAFGRYHVHIRDLTTSGFWL